MTASSCSWNASKAIASPGSGSRSGCRPDRSPRDVRNHGPIVRHRLRTWFIAGLIVFLPVAVTFSIIAWLFQIVDGLLGRLLPLLFGRAIPGVGLVASIIVIFSIGALVTNVLGRRLVEFFERVMLRI